MELTLQVQKLENKFIVLHCNKYVIHVRQQGIVCLTKQGLPGPSSDIETVTVGEDVRRGDLVIPKEGKFVKASSNDLILRDSPIHFFAFMLNDGLSNTSVQIRQFGIFTNPDWNLTIGANYYLGLDGNITVTPPTQGLLLVVGNALNATDLIISFGTPVWIGE